ncbi:MAG: hypothetical protein OEX07_01650 [Gammaproteobacteria bacterium]|nr:hypothetical protein [Gammaproteobacteria bacterium]
MLKNNCFDVWLFRTLLFYLLNAHAYAYEKQWYTNVSADVTHGLYKQSESLDTGSFTSLAIDLAYLERFGITLKITDAIITLKNNQPESRQNKFAFRVRKKSFIDKIYGSINYNLIYFQVSGKNADNVFAIAPEFNYLSNNQSILISAGYAYSEYSKNKISQIKVDQFNTSLGFSPFSSKLWINVKGYQTKNSLQTSNAISINLKWWPGPKARTLPTSYLIGSLLGTRRYAVEQDILLIYNTEDKQTNSYFVSATWNMMDNSYIVFTTGIENYISTPNGQRYNYSYVNFNISKTW